MKPDVDKLWVNHPAIVSSLVVQKVCPQWGEVKISKGKTVDLLSNTSTHILCDAL